MKNMEWIGPYRIGQLLKNCLQYRTQAWPPDKQGVYVISKGRWKGIPNKGSVPLYVGGNTGKSARFRMRIGDLIADTYGFFKDDESGHHSGGISIHNYCKRNKIHPNKLYIGWTKEIDCYRCAEMKAYKNLKPKLNKNIPAACKKH